MSKPSAAQPRIATSVLVLCCAAAAVGTAMFYAGASWPILFYRLAIDGFFLVLWLLAAAGWGICCVWPLGRGAFGGLVAVSAAAVGLGLQSLVILGLGLAGALNVVTAFAIIAIGIAAGGAWVWLKRPKMPSVGGAHRWLWLAAMPAMGIALVGSIFPPGILWGDEPNAYDVVEYHLQVPREWFEGGRILPLDHNVFSYFPFGVEMHYLLAMHLRGGPWAGMYLAQMMHVAICALAAAAVWAALGGGLRGTVGGVIFAVTPWTALLGPVAYDDGGLLLYTPLAIAWMWGFNSAPAAVSKAPPPQPSPGAPGEGEKMASIKAAALAGAMAGFAAGTKLTGAPVLWVALPIAFVISMRQWRALPVYLLTAVALFSPWAIRNFAWAGNPVFPEAMSAAGAGHFDLDQEIRWQRAHSPTSDQQSIGGHLKAFWNQIIGDERFGYLLAPAAVAAGIIAWRDRRARFMAMLVLLTAIYWLTVTHLQGRFFTPALAPMAMLIALTDVKFSRITAAYSLLLAIIGLWVLHPRLMHYVELNERLEASGGTMLGVENLSGLTPFDPGAAPPGVELYLAGDARAFLYQIAMTRLHYRTVFDVKPCGGGESAVIDWLGGTIPNGPNDLTLVDGSEISRFHRTYYGIPRLGAPELQSLASTPGVRVVGN